MGHRPSCAPVVLRYTIYDIYEACDERARAAEAAASGHTPAAGDTGAGADAVQPAERGAIDVSTPRTDASHVNTHMNDMTDVEQPDRKRQRGPRGVRGQGHRTGRARAGNED